MGKRSAKSLYEIREGMMKLNLYQSISKNVCQSFFFYLAPINLPLNVSIINKALVCLLSHVWFTAVTLCKIKKTCPIAALETNICVSNCSRPLLRTFTEVTNND